MIIDPNGQHPEDLQRRWLEMWQNGLRADLAFSFLVACHPSTTVAFSQALPPAEVPAFIAALAAAEKKRLEIIRRYEKEPFAVRGLSRPIGRDLAVELFEIARAQGAEALVALLGEAKGDDQAGEG